MKLRYTVKNFYDIRYYFKQQLSIKLITGFDFTESNKSPDDKMSLHYLGEKENLNPYEIGFSCIARVLEFYNTDKKDYLAYGFSGVLKNSESENYFFPINMNFNEPKTEGIEGTLSAYRKCVTNIGFGKNGNISYFLGNVLEYIKKSEYPQYTYSIILILTDGNIIDIEKAKDILIDYQDLPFSLVIIGIGGETFHELDALDGSKYRISNSKNEKAKRDMITFVQYTPDQNEISRKSLEAIPKQIEEYYLIQ